MADCHDDHCCAPVAAVDDCCAPVASTDRYRRILWIALVVNAAMFALEIGAGIHAGSSALAADALDFLGDAANYAISLTVLGMALRRRSQAALLKGASLAVFGLWVAGNTLVNALSGTVPEAEVMGAIGVLALASNVGVALLLYAYREGDANMRSVWICSRNDAIGNVAVLLAAAGVFGTGTGWPDIAVAAIMAALSLTGAWRIVTHALAELKTGTAVSERA
jgi:Co/Zn/Cd efflux system component